MAAALGPRFYDRPVVEVAQALVGCVLRHGETAGRIVETEAYHESEPACHAHVGLTRRTKPLFGPPGHAYVYRSYGIHALINAVCEPPGVGAAVLIRALEPLEGLELMTLRRAGRPLRELCSGPGKLAQALGIELELDGASLAGRELRIEQRDGARAPRLIAGERIGITRATELRWRFCDADSRALSRPWPAAMRA